MTKTEIDKTFENAVRDIDQRWLESKRPMPDRQYQALRLPLEKWIKKQPDDAAASVQRFNELIGYVVPILVDRAIFAFGYDEFYRRLTKEGPGPFVPRSSSHSRTQRYRLMISFLRASIAGYETYRRSVSQKTANKKH